MLINVVELRKLVSGDSRGFDKLLAPILDFCDFLSERKDLKNDEEVQEYLKSYLKQQEKELIEEFEKREEVDSVGFAEIAVMPLRKLCEELEYGEKETFIERYKYLMATIHISLTDSAD